jgi:hypothetical protein
VFSISSAAAMFWTMPSWICSASRVRAWRSNWKAAIACSRSPAMGVGRAAMREACGREPYRAIPALR